MAGATDSTAFFKEHALKVGLEQDVIDKFIAAKITTISEAAYAATPPGQVLTDSAVTDFLSKIGLARPALAVLANTRQLLFEAQTLALAHLKTTIEHKPESSIRQLPGAERQQRLSFQKTRLSGLDIVNDLEPAFSVYDAVTTQAEQGSLKYIHPSKVPTRQQEAIQGIGAGCQRHRHHVAGKDQFPASQAGH